jgi:Domain of unknown function (DUF4333)
VSTPPSSDDPRPGGADSPLPDDAPTAPHQPAGPPQWGPPQWGPPPQQQPQPWGQPQQPQPWGQPPAGGLPPWGPPPPAWAAPAPARRDRTRTLLIAALVATGLAIAGGVALLVYVLSSTILDRAAVEAAVAEQFEQREGVALDLECDERMIVRPGADYECEGSTADGEDVEILITVTDREGAYTWAED